VTYLATDILHNFKIRKTIVEIFNLNISAQIHGTSIKMQPR